MAGPKKAFRAKSEWSERVVSIQRVTKVVKGGKKMSFRAVIVVGNEQGKVGVGVGKAGDVITAVRKGVTDGKKNIISIPLTSSNSIPHPTNGRFGAAKLVLLPSAPGQANALCRPLAQQETSPLHHPALCPSPNFQNRRQDSTVDPTLQAPPT